MKRVILFLFVSFSLQCALAQNLRVVKDNVNCTYGIKDRDGNWVVEPTYILIEEYNTGYFRVRDEIGLGIFTPEGKPLLPCIHDNIDVSTRNWHLLNLYGSGVHTEKGDHLYFYAKHRDELLVYNLSGKKVGTFGEQTDLELDADFSIIGYNRNLRYTKYIDSSGQVLIDSIQGKLAPYDGGEYTIVANYINGRNTGSGNVRVVNREGEVLTTPVMDRALLQGENICFYTGKKYGVVSISGDTIIPPKYKRLDGQLSLSGNLLWPIYDENDLAGLMKNTGRVLVEPQYDKLFKLNGINRQEIAWMIEKDGRFRVLNSHGTELIPMKYDKLYPINFIWPQGNYRNVTTRYIGVDQGKHYYLNHQGIEFSSEAYDSLIPVSNYNYSHSVSISHSIITKRNGLYGVLNPDGTEFKPCVYDFRYQLSDMGFLFGEKEDLTEYYFRRDKMDTSSWSHVVSNGSLHIFTNRSRYRVIEKSAKTGKIIGVNENLSGLNQYDNLLTAQRSDTREWLFFNLKTKKRLPLKNITNFRYRNKGQYIISTRRGYHGMIDGDGEFIIDTIYNNIEFNSNSTKIWASKMVGNRFVSILLDSIGRQVLPNQFDGKFEVNSGDQIVSQNHKKGIIDSKTLRWKIRPNYLCLINFFDDYYYVGNDLNKKGIIRTNGETILPVVYDSIILLYTNCQLNGRCPNDQPRKIRWLVQKGSTEYLADENGKLINSRSSIKQLKAKLFFDDDTTFGIYNQYRAFPVLDYTPSLHFLRGLTPQQIQLKRATMWKSVVLRNEVLDTINRIWVAGSNNCNYNGYSWGVVTFGSADARKSSRLSEMAQRSCNCYQSNRYAYGTSYLVYQLRSIGAKFVTIDISYQNQNWGWDHLRSQAPPAIPNNQHINIIEDKGSARYVKLKDIFPDDDVLMMEFMEALKKRDDLKLECSSMENMLEMINGSFSFAEEGIILYLNQQNQYNFYGSSSVELLIPTESLSKLAGSKWIVPFLKN